MDQKENTEGPGRPEFEATLMDRAWVTRAANVGVPQEFIRTEIINPDTDLAISVKTLCKHFRRELDTGLANLAVGLMTPAFAVAQDKEHKDFAKMNVWAQQSRLGMKATTVQEIVGAGGETLGIPQLVVIRGGNTDPVDIDDGPDKPE